MSNNKIYFPKDERLNLCCISPSSTGLIIPLAPFGYPDIHLTIYIKEMQNKTGFQKIGIHLTNNRTGKMLEPNYFFEFNEELIKQNYSEKFKRLVDRYLSIIKKYIVEEKNLRNKNLVCYDCFNKRLFSSYPVDSREKAKNSYLRMIKDLKYIDKFNFEPCSDSKHDILIDLNTGKIYMKSVAGIMNFSSTSKMIDELDSAFKEVFPDEITWLTNMVKGFEKTLEGYKE